jgi:hypothetical protein
MHKIQKLDKPPLRDLFGEKGTASARVMAALPNDTGAVAKKSGLSVYSVRLHLARAAKRGLAFWTGEQWETTDAK